MEERKQLEEAKKKEYEDKQKKINKIYNQNKNQGTRAVKDYSHLNFFERQEIYANKRKAEI